MTTQDRHRRAALVIEEDTTIVQVITMSTCLIWIYLLNDIDYNYEEWFWYFMLCCGPQKKIIPLTAEVGRVLDWKSKCIDFGCVTTNCYGLPYTRLVSSYSFHDTWKICNSSLGTRCVMFKNFSMNHLLVTGTALLTIASIFANYMYGFFLVYCIPELQRRKIGHALLETSTL